MASRRALLSGRGCWHEAVPDGVDLLQRVSQARLEFHQIFQQGLQLAGILVDPGGFHLARNADDLEGDGELAQIFVD